jgi:hypothetical protein
MFADTYEFVMIAAHCRLCGLEVGAIRVIEKRGEVAAWTVTVDSGIDDETRTKANSPRSTPLRVSLEFQEEDIVDVQYGFGVYILSSVMRNLSTVR